MSSFAPLGAFITTPNKAAPLTHAGRGFGALEFNNKPFVKHRVDNRGDRDDYASGGGKYRKNFGPRNNNRNNQGRDNRNNNRNNKFKKRY